MQENLCPECGEEITDEGCHHHHTGTEVDIRTGIEYTVCDDCRVYWPLGPVR